jgi:DNA polymerase I
MWLDRHRHRDHEPDEMRADLVGICLCVEPGAGRATSPSPTAPRRRTTCSARTTWPPGKCRSIGGPIRCSSPLLEDPAILKIGQNLKYDAKVSRATASASRPSTTRCSCPTRCTRACTATAWTRLRNATFPTVHPDQGPDRVGQGQVTFDRVPIEAAVKLRRRGCRHHTAPLADGSSRSCTAPRHHGLRDAGTPARRRADATDGNGRREGRPDTLSRMSGAFAQKMARLEDEIHELAGERFNVGSPKQLGEILFDKMNLPGGQEGQDRRLRPPAPTCSRTSRPNTTSPAASSTGGRSPS